MVYDDADNSGGGDTEYDEALRDLQRLHDAVMGFSIDFVELAARINDSFCEQITLLRLGMVAVISGDLSDDIEVSDEVEPNDVIYIIFLCCPAKSNFFIMSPLDHAGRWFSGAVP